MKKRKILDLPYLAKHETIHANRMTSVIFSILTLIGEISPSLRSVLLFVSYLTATLVQSVYTTTVYYMYHLFYYLKQNHNNSKHFQKLISKWTTKIKELIKRSKCLFAGFSNTNGSFQQQYEQTEEKGEHFH